MFNSFASPQQLSKEQLLGYNIPKPEESVSGSEFSATSYRTNNTSVQDLKMSKDSHSKSGSPFYPYYGHSPYAKTEDSEEEDSDGSEESSEEDSEEDSEYSDDESEDPYRQWREYYQKMYRQSMYSYMPFMNYMMNPQMYYMMMQQQMGAGMGSMMNPMMNMSGDAVNQWNPMMMGNMNMNGMAMNGMNGMNGMNMNTMQMMNNMQMGSMQNNMQNLQMNNMQMNSMQPNGMHMSNLQQMTDDLKESMTGMTLDPEAKVKETISAYNLNDMVEEKEDTPSPPDRNVQPDDEQTDKTESKLISNTSELIKASRKSTVKSNRYPSVPSELLRSESKTAVGKRVTSLTSDFKPNETAYNSPTINDIKSLAYGLLDLALEEDDKNGESMEENERTVIINEEHRPSTENYNSADSLERQLSGKSMDSIVSGSSSKFLVSHKSNKSEPFDMNDLETPRTTTTPSPVHNQQSLKPQEKELPGAPVPEVLPRERTTQPCTPNDKAERVKPKKTKKSKKKAEKRQSRQPLAQMQSPHPPVPMSPGMNGFSGVPQFNSPYGGMAPYDMGMNSNLGSPMMSPMMDGMPKRQSIISPDSNRNSVMMNPGLVMQTNSPQSKQPHNLDPDMSKRIELFKGLRQVIASGNKSYEYRLKWVKTLITSTNYKLYAYINIKGEYIPLSDVQLNKGLFIKSSTQHITKLVRDLDSTNQKLTNDLKADICLIYGNLLKNHYAIKYDQTFDIEKNISEALRYYELALQYHSTNSKVLYNLGDMYEFEMEGETEEETRANFERAVSYYKQSARLGYNRAIYKMGLLYLNVPSMRSPKCIKILKDMSNIDAAKTELVDDDKEELIEIIGLSFYELGKMYEGVYPGDLTINDDFIKKCLESTPVNYAKALSMYNKSAKLNCLLAEVRLGKVYEYGELNRGKNANKSVQWYLKAVNSPLMFKRHPDAMVGLSRWYLTGSNGESKHIPSPNPERSFKWCDRAIKEFDTAEAFYQMGQLSEYGICSKPAYFWYQKAASMNYVPAIERLDHLNGNTYQQTS